MIVQVFFLKNWLPDTIKYKYKKNIFHDLNYLKKLVKLRIYLVVENVIDNIIIFIGNILRIVYRLLSESQVILLSYFRNQVDTQ